MRHIHNERSEWVRNISPAEFNGYKLRDGDWFDFQEFRDADFIHNAEPTFLIHLAKEVYDEGHGVYILTARERDVEFAIRVWLASYNITANYIHCVGGTRDTIAQNKKKVLLDIVSNHEKTFFYDDSQENVDIFTHEKLRSYVV